MTPFKGSKLNKREALNHYARSTAALQAARDNNISHTQRGINLYSTWDAAKGYYLPVALIPRVREAA